MQNKVAARVLAVTLESDDWDKILTLPLTATHP